MIHAPSHLAALAALLATASAWDVSCRKIPNALTTGIAVSGVAAQLAVSGPLAALQGVAAGALSLAVLWVAWSRGAIGGGDLKLGAGAATWLAPAALPNFALATCISAGALAVACYFLSARIVRAEVRSNLVHAALGLGARPVTAAPGRVPVPGGVAIALGALAAILLDG